VTSTPTSLGSASPAGPTPRVGAAQPVEVAGRLRLTATRLARRLRQEAASGLTPSQLAVLAVLDRDGPTTLGALAESERVAPPSITRVVAKLEEQGMLLRERDADDRRVIRVALTAKGRNLLAASRRKKTEWLAARLQQMSASELARVDQALEVLDAIVQESP
jgi:DNA-binding MarR family transcriptional regulator